MIPLKEPDTLDFLVGQISHLHHTRVHQLFEALGLYRGQPVVLFALWEREGLTQSELAAQMNNTPATITKMLQRMEKTGFITRKTDPKDQRITRVYLTEAGKAVQSHVEEIWAAMERETFSSFSDAERQDLHRYLTQIRQNLQSAIGECHVTKTVG